MTPPTPVNSTVPPGWVSITRTVDFQCTTHGKEGPDFFSNLQPVTCFVPVNYTTDDVEKYCREAAQALLQNGFHRCSIFRSQGSLAVRWTEEDVAKNAKALAEARKKLGSSAQPLPKNVSLGGYDICAHEWKDRPVCKR